MKLHKLLLLVVTFAMLQIGAFGQTVSYTGGTITEDFASMTASGTTTPNGWFVGSNTTTAISYTTTVTVNDGTAGVNAAVRGWNVGVSGDTDRALGVSPTGTNRYVEVRIMNATTMSISAINVLYDGEEWRTGNNATTINTNRLQFSADGVNYVNMGAAFQFVQPVLSPVSTALNGNDPANRVADIGGSFNLPTPVGPNSIVYLRWLDVNDPNTDPLLAMDNFRFTATLTTQPVTLGITSPTNNQVFPLTGTIPVSTFATGTVENVAFYIDGTYVSTDAIFPYTAGIPTTGLTLGNHTVTAVATNGTGVAVPATNSVIVQIVANQGPSVVISNSFSGVATGTVFLVGSGITNLVVARDDVAITNIEFFVDDVRTFNRTANTNFFSTTFLYIDVLPGAHQLKAIAYDNSGLTATATRDITVTNPPSNFTILVPNGADWKYLAGNSDPAIDGNSLQWYQVGFDDSSWSLGTAELGGGDAANGYPERTVIDIGPTGNRFHTIYFRKTFTVDDPTFYQNMVVSALYDDGFVLWLNGNAIWTNNIANVASGISYTNFANGSPNEGTSYSVTNIIPTELLVAGENTVAVEVHQVNATSSDLSFDLMIWGEQPTLPTMMITSPTNTQTFRAGVNVTINASSSTFVTNANFFVDGNPLGQDGTKPFSAIASNLSVGNHTLTVTGNDEFGNIANATPVQINVVPNSSPSVTIVSPVGVTNLLVGGNVIVTNTASDPDGVVARVDFYLDSRLLWSMANSNAWVNAGDLTAGTHIIRVVAVDDGGATATNSVTLNVTNPPSTDIVIANGESWKYWDEGVEPLAQAGIDWKQAAFNDTTWSNGVAEIGFGDLDANRPEVTVSRKVVGTITNATQIFRKHFTLPADFATRWTNIHLRILADDGAVVYLNGNEVYRSTNMAIYPAPVAYTDFARSTMPDDGTVFNSTNLPPAALTSILHSGDNVVAIDIHQNNVGSSDLSFDLMLWGEGGSAGPKLNVALNGSQVNVTWQGAGYTLQQNPNLGNSAGWVGVPGNPQNSYQFVPAGNQPTMFFRLIK